MLQVLAIHTQGKEHPKVAEREMKFIGLFGDRGHCGPHKPCNHNLYIGIIIFPHIDNPQSPKVSQYMLADDLAMAGVRASVGMVLI